jgi:hypothetical protein
MRGHLISAWRRTEVALDLEAGRAALAGGRLKSGWHTIDLDARGGKRRGRCLGLAQPG